MKHLLTTGNNKHIFCTNY